MKVRKTPIRTCIACREEAGKKQLIRMVKTADAAVEIDPTGKKAGRGAYIHNSAGCVADALKGKKLDRALRTAVPPQVIEELKAAVQQNEDEIEGA